MKITTTWLYHINPKSPEGYTYNWNVDHPKTLLRKNDKEWGASNMFKQVGLGDMICVYMKNIPPNIDGVYVVGIVTKVCVDRQTFVWEPDETRSAVTLSRPIPKREVQDFFDRSHGNRMQRLPQSKQQKWLRRLGRGEVVDGVPLVMAKGVPRALSPNFDPIVSREHGVIGELFVIKRLSELYPRAKGFNVVHVSKSDLGSDHDVAVMRGRKIIRLVEVKARVGVPGDPVIISERELGCRRANLAVHSIFIVYLNKGGIPRSVLEIGSRNSFGLTPRQYWLTPGFPGKTPQDRDVRHLLCHLAPISV